MPDGNVFHFLPVQFLRCHVVYDIGLYVLHQFGRYDQQIIETNEKLGIMIQVSGL